MSQVWIDGFLYCWCIENNEFSIADGTYKMRLTYSPKFKRYLPELLDVPYRTGIRIHSGKSYKNSRGCLLFGQYGLGFTLVKSRSTVADFISKLDASCIYTIQIEDNYER